MTHKLKTAPAVEPVTDAELQAHLGMNATDFAGRLAVLQASLRSARQLCESDGEGTGIAFVTQTWTYYAADFPSGSRCWQPVNGRFTDQIDLRLPLQSVTSIKYIDTSGVQQTLDPSLYQVDTVAGRVIPAYGQVWPGTRRQANAVEIEYVCGFGLAAAVPENIKHAIKLIVGQNERFQTAIEGGFRPLDMPNAAKQLLSQYRDYRGRF